MNPRAQRALILAAGAGTRMQAGRDPSLTSEQSTAARKGDKAFMPVAGRTFIDYQIDVLHSLDIYDICVLIGSDRIISGDFTVAVQDHPRGTAHAVLSAQGWAGERPFLVMNGDNLYPAAAIDAINSLDGPGLAGFDRDDLVATSNIPAGRINAFAVLERDASGNLERIIEKPSAAELEALPPPVLVSMNLWRLDARIFDACREVPPSPRGELELPAAVMLARARGMSFAVVPSAGPVLDLSQPSDIAEVSQRLGGAVR